MGTREQLTTKLSQFEIDIKNLEIAYEHYFTGIENRSPEAKRKKLAKDFRSLLSEHMTQNDLKFRLNSLSSKYQSYSGRWDRVLREIDEGRYTRHLSRIRRRSTAPTEKSATAQNKTKSTSDNLYEQLVSAHAGCSKQAPSREQVKMFLAKQEAVIKDKFGDRNVDYKVVTEGGKPKIKVYARA